MTVDRSIATGLEFSARTRRSGTNLPNNIEVQKGAVDAVKGFVRSRSVKISDELDIKYESVSRLGGTPLAVCQNNDIYGVIYLKDIIKPGIKERFRQLRRMGIRTVML